MMAELQGINFILKAWKKNPKLSKREIGGWYYPENDNRSYDEPFTEQEIISMKSFLKKNNPTAYYKLFPKNNVNKMEIPDLLCEEEVSALKNYELKLEELNNKYLLDPPIVRFYNSIFYDKYGEPRFLIAGVIIFTFLFLFSCFCIFLGSLLNLNIFSESPTVLEGVMGSALLFVGVIFMIKIIEKYNSLLTKDEDFIKNLITFNKYKRIKKVNDEITAEIKEVNKLKNALSNKMDDYKKRN